GGAAQLLPCSEGDRPATIRLLGHLASNRPAFWSAFFLFWLWFKSALIVESVPVHVMLGKLLSGQPHYHMWFLYMLLGLYLLTPFFRMVVAKATRKELMFLVLCLFMFAGINAAMVDFFSLSFVNWFLYYIPYFFAGHLIRQSDSFPAYWLLWVGLITSIMLTSLGSCYSGYFYSYLSMTVIPMSISIMYLLKRWDKPFYNQTFTTKLAMLSFGIYLVHPVVLEIINYHGHESLQLPPLLAIPILATVTFALSWLGAWLIHRIPFLRKTI
ncbi:MAG: acyltransferase family protein, partial [Mariprofundaceae bacterium]|nr:acyltransferase family protein [Mariprofundaceae bacterium]